MKKILSAFKTEDWVVTFASILLLAAAALVPQWLPALPKNFTSAAGWIDTLGLFLLVAAILYLGWALLGRPAKGLLPSLAAVFVISLAAQFVATIPQVAYYGFESVFFSVIFGLVIRNLFHIPEWMKPAIQSEYYIKIGVVCLGAAITTARVVGGDDRKLSYIVSLILIIVVPMIYLMPWLADTLLPLFIDDPAVRQEVAGAWIGGTIDTTSGVAASSAIAGELANQHAVIIKGAQNVLIGVVAFFVALYLSTRRTGTGRTARPSLGIVWEKFPKFIIGFVAASLVFSLCQSHGLFHTENGKLVEPRTAKMFSTLFFSLAFVCVGLETRLKEIVSRENRSILRAFLTAQTFNIVVTLLIAWLIFGILKPMWA